MFTTPYVYVDLDKVEKNIKNMISRLNSKGIEHWPHIKSHKSVELAKKQLEYGAKGITCAKLSEAEVMAEGGIQPILIAYPIIGEEKLNRLGKLAKKIDIRTTVDSLPVAEGLSTVGETIGKKIEVLIEIDGGSHRGGVQPGQATLDFAREIIKLPGIQLVGVFTYVGQIYGCQTEEEIKQETRLEAQILLKAKELLKANGIEVTVTSGGSTVSSFHAEELEGISQSRAGNYIFGDMNAIHVGVYTESDCALKVRSTVISVPLPGYATIDAGTKTLTSDLSCRGNTYGLLVSHPDIQLFKLNEEHGYLSYDPKLHTLHVGDQVEIIPNHCCVIPNLYDSIYSFRGEEHIGSLKIDARGKNY
ncbi:alanine racemase [Neobacillus sp. YIM B02564]|uniref:Alanine racemase n=1 Tax=Neobacillus paridis TaxID=2803862 RepID=A0ABS1TTW3_9BACI|nr:alanine racemase [Neobacillus paridis]MBL4954728.1 alanine racemase [Neobacillus paridis]